MDDKLFELMNKIYAELQDIKCTIAELEHKTNDKMSSLFDAQELQLNKSIDISQQLVDINNSFTKLRIKMIKQNLK